jgi:hypothetical protein
MRATIKLMIDAEKRREPLMSLRESLGRLMRDFQN